MLSLFLGITAFLLFFVYDINSIRWRSPFLHSFFAAGSVLLGICTALDVVQAWRMGYVSTAVDIVFLLLGCISLAGLIYCLFFALPKETYSANNDIRRVCSSGVYALCRHPGFWPFLAMYLFWGLAAWPGRLLFNGMVFSALNFVYIWFQDRVIFPGTFCDYKNYQQSVPFLLPGRADVIKAYRTLFRPKNEEGDL